MPLRLRTFQVVMMYNVKFAIDEEDDIIVIAETNDTDLTGEEIKTLVSHVVHACDTLWSIYPE